MSFIEDLFRAISQVTGSNWKAPSDFNQQQRTNQKTPAQNVGGATAPRTQAPPRTVAPTSVPGNNRWADFIANLAQAQQESGSKSEVPMEQMYDAPVSTPETKAPSNQETKEKKSRFDEAVERNIKNINLNELNPFYTPQANALELESTAEDGDKDKGDKQTEEVAPNVTVEGSNDANANKNDYEQKLRDAIGDEAFEQLQQGVEAGEKRQAERKAAEKQREEAYQNMIGTSPQAQLDRAKLEQDIARASAQQDRDLLMSGVTDEDAKARYDASLNQSAELRDSEVAEQIKEAEKAVDAEKTGKDEATENPEDVIKYYYASDAKPEGYTEEELAAMYEDAIYNAAMANEDYRKLFDEAGYGDYGSYAAYGSLGDTLDYDSRREVTRDIFGLDETQPDLEIQGLKDIYFENGVINDKMTPDEMLDAILEAHWGAENIINPYQWMSDEAYQADNPFNGSTAGEDYARYWLENGIIPVDEAGVFGSFEGDWGQLDNEDFATLVAAGNIINQLNAGWRPTDADLAAMSQVFQNGGDLASFAYLPEDESESEYKGREWTPNRYTNAYAMPQLLQSMAAAEGGDYSGLTPYVDSNMALGDKYMTDTIAKAIEDATGKKVGRKDR